LRIVADKRIFIGLFSGLNKNYEKNEIYL